MLRAGLIIGGHRDRDAAASLKIGSDMFGHSGSGLVQTVTNSPVATMDDSVKERIQTLTVAHELGEFGAIGVLTAPVNFVQWDVVAGYSDGHVHHHTLQAAATAIQLLENETLTRPNNQAPCPCYLQMKPLIRGDFGIWPCIPMEEERELKDQLLFSRSFSEPLSDREQMEQVMAIYAQRAATRLHRQNGEVKVVTAWAMTSHFNEQQSHAPSATVSLPEHSADPVVLTKAAKALLPEITPGVRYAKAGITVTELRPAGSAQMLEEFVSPQETKQVGPLLEKIRSEHGNAAIGLGRGGMREGPSWQMRREMMSPRYTTHWDEILTVHAK